MSYKDLLTYKQSEEIYDLTVIFCQRLLSGSDNFRLRDQMIHAARSGKQNIAEGASQGTSLKGYIKLLGVARGSLEELLEDYLDLSRQRRIIIFWIDKFVLSNRNLLTKEVLLKIFLKEELSLLRNLSNL